MAVMVALLFGHLDGEKHVGVDPSVDNASAMATLDRDARAIRFSG
jgi:hypothetical protein